MTNKSQLHEPFHQNIRNALLELDIDENTKQGEIKKQLSALLGKNDDYKVIYLKLLTMNKLLLGTANPIWIFKSIHAQMELEPESDFGKLAHNFLYNFVKPRFEYLKEYYRENKQHIDLLVVPFDHFFAKVSEVQILTDQGTQYTC